MTLNGQCQSCLDSLFDMLHEQGPLPHVAGKGPESQHCHNSALKSYNLLTGLLLLLVVVAGIMLSCMIFGNTASDVVY